MTWIIEITFSQLNAEAFSGDIEGKFLWEIDRKKKVNNKYI